MAAFELAFRELYVRDLIHADAGDVRMGAFILCAAFLDALALAYSAETGIRTGRAKWKRFLRTYLGQPYKDIWDSYSTFRSPLLHNYSASGLAFTHGPAQAAWHLIRTNDGVVVLHRETFVRDVVAAFEAFAADVRANAELRARVFAHFVHRPPMGLVTIDWKDEPPSQPG
jgi:hypothetical protein